MRILIIDDEPAERELIKHYLSLKFASDLTIIEAESGKAGLAKFFSEGCDCILLDFRMADMSGLEFLAQILNPRNQCPIIMMSGYGNDQIDMKAMELGVSDYIPKDEMNPILLERAIRYAIGRQKTLSQLNKALTLKDQFLHQVSHQFKTPLNAIVGISSTLTAGVYGDVTPKQATALAKIKGSALEINTMVDNILTVLSLDTLSNFQMANFDVVECFKSCINTFTWSIQKKGLNIETHFQKPEITIHSNRDLLVKILINIISNAVKFTKQGVIEASISTIQSENTHQLNDKFVEIKVKDSGGGIPYHIIEIIKKFDGSKEIFQEPKLSEEGIGLGLLVTKSLIFHLGGKLHIDRAMPQGTEVTILLPVDSFTLANTENIAAIRGLT